MANRKIHIFIPCFIDQLFPGTAFNLIKVLEKAGCDVTYNPNQTCCGQPAFNAGFLPEARAVAAKFAKDFETAACIVSPSASCTGFTKNYTPGLFDNNSQHQIIVKTSNKIFELSDFLVNQLYFTDFGASLDVKATYHDSCAGLRECNIKKEPRVLLEKVAGLQLVEMQDNETCCGFGGTFAVKFESISVAMAEQKLTNAMATGATHIISTDLSCLMHIDAVAKKQNIPVTCMHLADVLAQGW